VEMSKNNVVEHFNPFKSRWLHHLKTSGICYLVMHHHISEEEKTQIFIKLILSRFLTSHNA
jgi:hypothetical protein